MGQISMTVAATKFSTAQAQVFLINKFVFVTVCSLGHCWDDLCSNTPTYYHHSEPSA